MRAEAARARARAGARARARRMVAAESIQESTCRWLESEARYATLPFPDELSI